jgi:hypothetical protein
MGHSLLRGLIIFSLDMVEALVIVYSIVDSNKSITA